MGYLEALGAEALDAAALGAEALAEAALGAAVCGWGAVVDAGVVEGCCEEVAGWSDGSGWMRRARWRLASRSPLRRRSARWRSMSPPAMRQRRS
ncbi:MAG TPA: hypothetical protein VGU46_09580 [Acidobacteriaceae bacterium]|nr:hypothetical protein [Acidobacteriaceae bacterium]